MRYVICYDISDNATRSTVAKILKSNGLDRIQKSVFQGDITKATLKIIKSEITGINDTMDIIFIFQCGQCVQREERLLKKKIILKPVIQSPYSPIIPEIIPHDKFIEIIDNFDFEIGCIDIREFKGKRIKSGVISTRIIHIVRKEIIIIE